jgi:hypothetical protein
MPPGTLGGTPDCSSRVITGRDAWRSTRRCSSNSHPPGTLGRTPDCSSRVITGREPWRITRRCSSNSHPPGTLGRTPDCSSRVITGREPWRITRRCSSNSHATKDTGKNTSLCSSGVVAGKISRWNGSGGGSSAFVPSVIAQDFAGGVTKAVETQTAGLGPDGPTPEAVSAEATCGATLSEDILIGCDRTNRSCSPKQTI